MTEKNKQFLKAAVAGLMGAAIVAMPSASKAAGSKKMAKKQSAEVVKCYGVNKCKGFAKCAGKGHECAGHNSCKGQGWLLMPKESCEAIEGGALTPPADAAPAMDKK